VNVTCAYPTVCYQYVRYYSIDNVGNTEEIKTTVVIRIDKEKPVTSETPIASSDWTATDQVVTLTRTDGNGSGIKTTYYCVYTQGDTPCTPDTEGTVVNVTCAYPTVCYQYVNYRSEDKVGNLEDTKTTVVIRIDKQAPLSSDDWTDNWTQAGVVTVNLSYTDYNGSGVKTTYYCVDTTNDCIPSPTSGEGTVVTVNCLEDTVCTQYVRYFSVDNVNNSEADQTGIKSDRVRQDLEEPVTIDDWTDSDWVCPGTITVNLTADDGIGSGVNATYYCVDTSDNCVPSIQGTEVTVTCPQGSECIQFVRYRSVDNVNNVEITKSDRVRQDLLAPAAGKITYANGWFPMMEKSPTMTWDKGTDTGSGIRVYSIQRRSAPLSGTSPCDGVCGDYAEWGDVSVNTSDMPYKGDTVTFPLCAQYRMSVSDVCATTYTCTDGTACADPHTMKVELRNITLTVDADPSIIQANGTDPVTVTIEGKGAQDAVCTDLIPVTVTLGGGAVAAGATIIECSWDATCSGTSVTGNLTGADCEKGKKVATAWVKVIATTKVDDPNTVTAEPVMACVFGDKNHTDIEFARVAQLNSSFDLVNLHTYPNPVRKGSGERVLFAVTNNMTILSGVVTIQIYDIRGKLVRTLVEPISNTSRSRPGDTAPGIGGTILFNGWDVTGNSGNPLPSGVYLYRLEVTSGNQSRSAVGRLAVIR
jgi:hypothetical protein